MLKAEQIPDEVVKAALKAWEEDDKSFRPNAKTIAAALNAWPKMHVGPSPADARRNSIILPLPQKETSA